MTAVPVLHGERVTLRPFTGEDVEALAAVLAAPSVRRWLGPDEDMAKVARELMDEPIAFAVDVGGTLAGWLGVTEEDTPDNRHAGLDILLGPDHQDRGLGSEALRVTIRWLAERGHHRLTIDPSTDNERAIRAYEAIGFRPVGVMRSYERSPDGTWHDGLLMDLLLEELRPPRSG